MCIRDSLLAETVVIGRARRVGSKGEDRLLVGGTLLQTDALGDHGLEDFPAEHFLYLLSDVAPECRPFVVHRDDDSENAERRVRPLPHLLDRLEQIVGSFEREVRPVSYTHLT